MTVILDYLNLYSVFTLGSISASYSHNFHIALKAKLELFKLGAGQPAAGACLISLITFVRKCIHVCVCVYALEAINNYRIVQSIGGGRHW